MLDDVVVQESAGAERMWLQQIAVCLGGAPELGLAGRGGAPQRHFGDRPIYLSWYSNKGVSRDLIEIFVCL